MTAGITVAVVDDHATTRAGTRWILTEAGFAVIAELATVPEVYDLLRHQPPDVMVLDLNLRGGSAFEHIAALCSTAPDTAIVVLTMHDESAIVRAALDAGAHGYLLKDSPGDQLVAAVTAVARGGEYLAPELGARLTRRTAAPDSLTPRERTALQLWAQGHTNQDVSAALSVSLRTTETLRASLKTRLGLQNRADINRYVATHLAPEFGEPAPPGNSTV